MLTPCFTSLVLVIKEYKRTKTENNNNLCGNSFVYSKYSFFLHQKLSFLFTLMFAYGFS